MTPLVPVASWHFLSIDVFMNPSAIYEAISTYEVAYMYKLHVCTLYTTKWQLWGMSIHRKTNFALSPMLYELDCNRHSYLRDSNTSMSPRKRLASIGALCQVLLVHKNSVGRRIEY